MPKIEPVPDQSIKDITGSALYTVWEDVIARIDALYEMEKEWYGGGKAAQYELKFRRGGKTLVSLFPKADSVGLMIIFGKDERAKFDAQKTGFSSATVARYNEATTYHDGKWIMYQLPDAGVLDDLPALLAIKRKPNKKVL